LKPAGATYNRHSLPLLSRHCATIGEN